MIVTATRMEQALSEVGTTATLVGSQQIQEQQINTAGTVLRQVPSVEITQSGSAGTETDVSIRGSTAAETLILVDGVALNSGATGGFDICDLTTDNLAQVEVVRGAGGALYGSSAIGGVVNFITRGGNNGRQHGYGRDRQTLFFLDECKPGACTSLTKALIARSPRQPRILHAHALQRDAGARRCQPRPHVCPSGLSPLTAFDLRARSSVA
jgi:hypothetical protein